MERLSVLSRQLTASSSNLRAPLIPSREEYDKLYKWSIEDPNSFWAEQAKQFYWHTPIEEKHCSFNFDSRKGPIDITFFKGGKTNLCYNAVDRWVTAGLGDKPCFIWEGNEESFQRVMTWSDVQEEVCRVANYLKSQGVKKGDAVAMYLPMNPELPIAMLACARLGALHCVVFAGFSAEALGQRVADCKAKVVFTTSRMPRGSKFVETKQVVDQALAISAKEGWVVPRVVVTEEDDGRKVCPQWTEGRDVWYSDAISEQSPDCGVEWVDAEDPSFLLYTSGSTGKPKGVVHCTGGYMVGTALTSKYVFDLQPGDLYWCTADCGWITGHSYVTYGPMLNGATNIMLSAPPTHPNPDRIWRVVQRHKPRVLYTAPTLVRSLLASGDQWVTKYDLSSLAILGTVGEPINVEGWKWFHEVVGKGNCPIVDTFWQTETGAHVITPLPYDWFALKPGCATLPFFGVQPVILDPSSGKEVEGAGDGVLCMKGAWPSLARTIYGDHDRFAATYFDGYKGYYFTGDGARRDTDGYIWITGRVDDVINVSGHRIGTAEVESALTEHNSCSEAAVIGIDHPIKGQSIYAFVTLKTGVEADKKIKQDLVNHVRKVIGPFAAPDVIHWAPGLPKTRSGKIMRRVLRKIASKEEKELGDISTLAEPGVVQQLIDLRGK
nr:acetyl-coenzyme a synthetase (ACSA) [Polytomella parva]|eukprot:CAMPEP_0175039926 /NCGR_PEP_ID=MMETSP0052_2-20121109/922_1 /TAXON_ID=51329 ORGANISM="Polytomella parva, Strain SAG 63-3" /NCGR_SAMPLE_ID=MMETSP0052_2 /ASSEMBLY_ACC=CAM_ASM_000194 /LENGTH=663 /DNA_ID=CAMNT_0016301967 /DNA_START=100 /DNA_END=2091 /DNA_ORIENTATION=-